MDLRSILEWDIAFRLRSVPGVVEVNSYGGEMKTYEVQLDPDKLVVATTCRSIRVFDGARAQQRQRWRRLHRARAGTVRHPRRRAWSRRLSDIDNIVVSAEEDGTPVYIRNLGQTVVRAAGAPGRGDPDGKGETVTGVVMMLMGENSAWSSRRVSETRSRRSSRACPEASRRYVLRPHGAGAEDDRHGAQEPGRGRHPRRRGPAAAARQRQGRPHRRAGHSAVDAVRVHRHGASRLLRKPDEPRARSTSG